MFITLATVLINSHMLGKEGLGSISLLQFGLLLVTGMAGFVGASAVVYVRRSHSPKDFLTLAYLWCVISAISASYLGAKIGAIPSEWMFDAAILGLLQSIFVFHTQLLIASGKIKEHNITFLAQSAFIFCSVVFIYFIKGNPTPEGFASALSIAFAATVLLTILFLKGTWNDRPTLKPGGSATKILFKNGAQGQTGSILQLITNRLNLSILENIIGSAGAGVYSVVYYGVEAVWTIARALAPMLNSEVAKATSSKEAMNITSGYLKQTLTLTLPLVLAACLTPEWIYAWIFGIDGIAMPLRLLAPGMIAGAVANIIAHHLSGIGLHRWNAITSGLALIVLISTSWYLIPSMEVCGAAIAASCAYSFQALALVGFWVKSNPKVN